MIDGKVADPEDPFHQYMLNAYACLGMSRIAETLHEIDPSNSRPAETGSGIMETGYPDIIFQFNGWFTRGAFE